MASKSKFQSLTFWGGLVLAVSHFLESEGLLPVGMGESVASAMESIGGFLLAFGLRRAVRDDLR